MLRRNSSPNFSVDVLLKLHNIILIIIALLMFKRILCNMSSRPGWLLSVVLSMGSPPGL